MVGTVPHKCLSEQDFAKVDKDETGGSIRLFVIEDRDWGTVMQKCINLAACNRRIKVAEPLKPQTENKKTEAKER